MEEKRKNGKGALFCIIALLVVAVIGLTGYIIVDKKLVTNGEKENSVSDNKTIDKSKDSVVNLDITNSNIVSMFKNAHAFGYITDEKIFNNKKLSVADMDTKYKFLLAANSLILGTTTDMILEENVKIAYEKIFGPNTYTHIEKLDFNCPIYTYNPDGYFVAQNGGCGGSTGVWEEEKIISAKRYSDRIEITSAVIFFRKIEDITVIDDTGIYKDYNRTEKLADISTTADDSTSIHKKLNDYIDENKNNIQQYTYTFTLNEDGFYYYTGVERTKE